MVRSREGREGPELHKEQIALGTGDQGEIEGCFWHGVSKFPTLYNSGLLLQKWCHARTGMF